MDTSIPVEKHVSVASQTLKHRMFSAENFRNDTAGLHFYTGVENIEKFFFILYTLGPSAFCLQCIFHNVVNISVPNQFFLVLMKLRRHTTNFEQSRMFETSEKAVQNIIITWINFMAKQWGEINIWPSGDLVRYYAPTRFKKKFPSTRVIVDGTEFPIKKPKNPKSQQKTFSTYKNRNTVKVLVGSTPGGLVSFISPAYGGSASDRQITERSSLMTCCDPYDSIMADRGFSVQDLFATQNVAINMPTFFKKKNRLTGETVIKDRKISSKRVHIERIIGLAKTFKILTEPMTATETNLSTEITFVCFFLCNFRKCIVSKNA
ncbi:uncharacterized protein LOC127713058 [Mytilus californianus]|uniref:uncharacterized protein LOC127713058 n=1 Tax=Mytilus californianus TaxID=6549 RepID=UPI00224678D2|nr:uncharacterized protein LOC127713058 [Mytilus californianus]